MHIPQIGEEALAGDDPTRLTHQVEQQHTHRERFGDVVVRSGVEADDDVDVGITSSHEDDGQIGVR